MSASSDRLQVSEIYASLQGESSWAGLPCGFVRLTGCNLRCVWCDSAFAFHGGEPLAVDEVAARAIALAVPLVEITGGEPLLQRPALDKLFSRLLAAGCTVLVETSGSLDVSGLDPRVHRIVDVKCPGSGEARANLWSNLDALGAGDEVKFVIASRRDYEWAREVVHSRGLEGRVPLLMGTVFGALEPHRLAGWILEDRLRVRFQLQLHKQLWPPEARGT